MSLSNINFTTPSALSGVNYQSRKQLLLFFSSRSIIELSEYSVFLNFPTSKSYNKIYRPNSSVLCVANSNLFMFLLRSWANLFSEQNRWHQMCEYTGQYFENSIEFRRDHFTICKYYERILIAV